MARKKRSMKKLWSWLGILLIIAGTVLLGYFIYQKVQIKIHQNQLRKAFEDTAAVPSDEPVVFENVVIAEPQPMRLIIPKIGADLIVQIGDVFDMALLDKGPVHFQMSDLPSTESGNVAIAGHRGTRWGFFTDIDQLEPGDQLFLDVAGYRFIYETEWDKLVDPDDWSVIDSTDEPVLTLETCHPKHSKSTHRLIVRAKLVSVTGAS